MVNQNQMRNNWRYIVLILIIAIISIGSYVFISASKLSMEITKDFKDFYIMEQKLSVKKEIENRYDEISYDLVNINKDYNNLIKSKIQTIVDIMNSQSFFMETDKAIKQDLFVNKFEQIVEKDESYLYFVLNPEGYLLRSGTDDAIEGLNLLNTKDKDGVYYVKEMIKAKSEPEGIFVTYYWPKVKNGAPLKKTAYCYYIPEYDLIIGTGAYEEDVLLDLKNQVFERLQDYYEGSNNYIFVHGYDGKAYVSGDKKFVGTDISNIVTNDGRSIHELFLDKISSEQEGFVTYFYNKRNTDEISQKISFVKKIDDWGIYMGMGFHTDNLNNEVNKFREIFEKRYSSIIFYTILSLIVTGFLILLLIRRGLKIQSEYIKQEEAIYEQFLQMTSEAVILISNFGKVEFTNNIIEETMNIDINDYIKDSNLIFDKVKENIYKIDKNELVYYFEQKSENIIYHGINSTIYFLKDITNHYIKTDKMEKLALHDELTHLPNRRKLLYDFYNIYKDTPDTKEIIIAMLDIDHFKIVNDTYGHKMGDKVLKIFAEFFKSNLRNSDGIYRYGGEEFVVILREIEVKEAVKKLTQINKQLSVEIYEKLDIKVTFSGGVTCFEYSPKKEILEKNIKIADKLLYKAKNNGRNQIISL